MRLTDLEPRWLVEDGRKLGFVFRCPTRPDHWQTCFFESGRRTMSCDGCRSQPIGICPHSQMGLALATGIPETERQHIQPCNPACGWTVHGPAEFATLTVTPSLDGSAAGNWHGFITNGEIVGGL